MVMNSIRNSLGYTRFLLIILTFAFGVSCRDTNDKPEDGQVAISPIFKKIDPSQSGILFSNNVEENYQRNYFDTFAYVYNGAGVATGDINNDGLMDIYFSRQ
jgi:hypothetical protein